MREGRRKRQQGCALLSWPLLGVVTTPSDSLGHLLGRHAAGLPRAVCSERRKESDQQLSQRFVTCDIYLHFWASWALVAPSGISSLCVSKESLKQGGVGASRSESGGGSVLTGRASAAPAVEAPLLLVQGGRGSGAGGRSGCRCPSGHHQVGPLVQVHGLA